MPDNDNLLTDGSNDQKYFINTPQIVLALCRNPYDFTLWSVIKMIAGEHGVCKLSTPDLATLSMMSTGKVSDSRAYLVQVGLLEGSCYREPSYPQPVWHLHIPDIWLQNITWRQLYNSLKDRVELKAKLKALFEEADIYRRFVPENFLQLDGLQDVNVKSLHNMKPSQYEEGIPQNEEGVSQNERGIPQNETKKNHVEPNKTIEKPAAASAAAAEKSNPEKGSNSPPFQKGTTPVPSGVPPTPPGNDLAFTEACRAYQRAVGNAPPEVVADEIKEWLKRCPAEWLLEALKKMGKANSSNWGYVESIMKKWESCGGPQNDHKSSKIGASNGYQQNRNGQPLNASPNDQSQPAGGAPHVCDGLSRAFKARSRTTGNPP